MRDDGRGSLYLLTGVILGVVMGLLYVWLYSPTEYVDTNPSSLRADYKDAYRAAIASAYNASGDLTRAEARLALLREDNLTSVLAAQSQRYLAEGYSYNDAVALARLSAALEGAPAPASQTTNATETQAPSDTPALEESLTPAQEEPTAEEAEETENEAVTPEGDATQPPTPEPSLSPTATLTRTPFLTFTPLPTRTPTPTLSPPYFLLEQALVCEPAYGEALIQIYVQNAAQEGVPGVEIILQSEAGEERFYTGLKPEIDWGYADYAMTPESTYSLHISKGGEPVDLFVPECSDDQDERYWGSWRLIFTHP
jgi:hypothetical protein